MGTNSCIACFHQRRKASLHTRSVCRFGAFLRPFTKGLKKRTSKKFPTRKSCVCSLNELQDRVVSFNWEDVVVNACYRSPQQVLEALQVDKERGLSEEQVRQRQMLFGKNQVAQQSSVSWWQRILEQFQDRLVLLLLAAAFISLLLALNEQSNNGTWNAFIEPIVILVILVINAVIGVVQQTNAERAVEALKAYETDQVIVIRDGKKFPMDAKDLVPGDIVELNTGMKVAADMRIVEILSSVLLVDQSILTGESVSVSKISEALAQRHNQRLVIQDKTNILFQGTTITQGRCIAVVVGIGSATEFGKIQSDLSNMNQQSVQTPLQEKLDEFGKLLTNIVLVICGVVWIIHIDKFAEHGGIIQGAIYYFKVAVALAVAAVPEGLPAVVTTCLALGAQRMAKQNAIVKNLPCVETLGCTSVICCDKTGTLTSNKMRAQQIFLVDWQQDENLQWLEIQMTENGKTRFFDKKTLKTMDPTSVPSLLQLGCIASLCNDASVSFRDGKTYPIGDPTELALLYLAETIGVEKESVADNNLNTSKDATSSSSSSSTSLIARKYWTCRYKKRRTFEFSRSRKSMSVLVEEQQNETEKKSLSLLVKGAPENILQRSRYIQSPQGKVIALDDSKKQTILQNFQDALSSSALSLRCIGFAYKPNASDLMTYVPMQDNCNFEDLETDLIFIGIVGIADPPREQVKDSIRLCKSAGIRVIMVTGDNAVTAQGIARQVGLLSSEDVSSSPDKKKKILTSQDFDQLLSSGSRETVDSAIRNLVILARVEPLQKLKLVEYLQKNREIVAMTGDGVNDAPALQKADIGISMGSGTWVAKAASKIVLVDDDFSTIVAAVKEGRSIYMNLKHVIRYVISSNIGEVCCILLSSVLGMPEVLIPVQLLWVNLITDGLPATALSFNTCEPNMMQQPPRSPQAPFIDGTLLVRFFTVGSFIGVASIGGFVYWYLFSSSGPHLTWQELTSYEHMTNALWKSANGGKTMALSVLVVGEMFNALNGLSESESIFQVTPLSNPLLLVAISTSVLLHLMIVYIPWLQKVFSVTPLSMTEWLVVVGLSIPVLGIEETFKWFSRHKQQSHQDK